MSSILSDVHGCMCDVVAPVSGVLGNDEVLKSKSVDLLERFASTEDAYCFVVDLLPKKVLEWIEAYAKPASIHVDMLLPCMLAAFSGVAGTGIAVVVDESGLCVSELAISHVTLAPSGTRKTQAYKIIHAALEVTQLTYRWVCRRVLILLVGGDAFPLLLLQACFPLHGK